MRVVKVVIAIVLALVLVPTGLLTLLAATDLAPVQGLIESRASDVLGREVSIAGTRFDLWPRPRLAVTKIAVDGVGRIDAVDLNPGWSGNRPAITGRVTADALDLRPLMPPKGASPPGSKSADDPLFPSDPLPFDQLQRADGRVELSIGRLTLHDGSIDRVEATVGLDQGRLRIEPLRIAVAGGSIEGAVTADANTVPVSLQVMLQGRKLALDGLLRLASQPEWVRVLVDAAIALRADGPAPADLARSLAGQVTLIAGEGRLASEIVDALFAKVGGLASVLTRARIEQAARLSCGAFDLVASGGIVDVRTGILDTAAGRVLANGTVDLGREQLDLVLLPQIAAFDPSASVPVKVSGRLAMPRVGVDRAAAVERLAALLDDVEPSKASAAGFARLAGSDRPCERAPPTKGRRSIPDDVGGARELLEKGLKGLLGR